MGANKRGSGLQPYYENELFNKSPHLRNAGRNREVNIQRMLERKLSELSINKFHYDNLPESCTQRFIETTMLFNGLVVWYYDEDFDKLLAVRGAAAGAVNYNDDPISFTTVGPAANIVQTAEDADVNRTLAFAPRTLNAYLPAIHSDASEAERKTLAVGMYPNALRLPEFDVVMLYSTRLATIDRTLEINTKNARKPKVVMAPPNTQLSWVNVSRQQDEGVDVIQLSGAVNPGEVMGVLDLGITAESFDKLSVYRARVWNECMGLLGIDNANQDKKERLVEAEVSANDAQTDVMQDVELNARRLAVEQINHCFGTKIKVDYNINIKEMAAAAANALGIDPDEDDGVREDDE